MEITRVVWDHENTPHVRAHGIARWEVQDIVQSGAWVASTHHDYPEQTRITGRTFRGRFLTIAFEPTDQSSKWRPVTAWDATAAEEAYYLRESR